MAKALGLFSGGLDSMLAATVLKRAGVEVEGITFVTPFFDAERAKISATHIDLPLTVMEIGPEHLETVVKTPRYGYGSNMNPCIDCHGYMFRKAGELMDERGFDFLFSGEVLGQRPMSQNKQALGLVAKLSGRPECILRPLSALVLPETPMEEGGLVERQKLAGLTGRSRKPQMELAKELGISDYPAPAGGCLLTEPGFSRRLKDLLDNSPLAGVEMVDLLKHGRHLRLSPKAKLIVGRNQKENLILESLAPKEAVRMIAQGIPGPLGLYIGPADGPELELAAEIVAGYGKAPAGQPVQIKTGSEIISVVPLHRRQAHGMLL
jgi:tRNA-specific 2-thiouridylase